jgi:REP element-mobilizing transposase RayT
VKPKRLSSPPYNPGVRNLVADKSAWSKKLAPDEIKRGFLGWHENGYLPHRDEPGLTQFVTFRLADSFPAELRSEWEALFSIEDDQVRRTKFEEYLDRGRGQCHLRRPEIASIVERTLLFRHEVQYELIAWSVMPNHVHVLFDVKSIPMSQILDAWKGYSAKEINKVLKTKGKLWQDGYWDTYMRSGEHQLVTRSYVENNPVAANLIKSEKDWPWSSARFRDRFERLCLPEG